MGDNDKAGLALAKDGTSNDEAVRLRPSPWRIVRFTKLTDLENFSSRMSGDLGENKISHNIEFAAVEHGWHDDELLVLVDEACDRIVGAAIFRIEKTPLVGALGPIVLFKWKAWKYLIRHGPIIRRSNPSMALSECFDELSGGMKNGGVIFMFAVPVNSELYEQLSNSRSRLSRRFFVLPWGPESTYCCIRWDGSVEHYLKSINSKHRSDLRRCRRVLFSNPALKCEVRSFKTTSEVNRFLEDSTEISNKTWQKRQYGTGVVHGGAVERTIRFSAERGSFLGFILYINDQPVAFRYGFINGKTYAMTQTGYDPAWSHHEVGKVLFFEALHELERLMVPVTNLDLSAPANVFKNRTSNEKYQVRNFYLFKHNSLGALQSTALKTTDLVSRSLGAMFDRFQVRQKVIRMLGKERSVAKARQGD